MRDDQAKRIYNTTGFFLDTVEEAVNEPTLRVDADEVVICSLKSYYSDYECKKDGEKIVCVFCLLSLIHGHFYSVLSSGVQSNVSMSSHQADVVLSYLSTCAREPNLTRFCYSYDHDHDHDYDQFGI